MSRIVIFTLSVLLGISLGVGPASASDAGDPGRGATSRTLAPSPRPACSTQGAACHSFATRKSRAFRKGRLSNSHGIRVPRRIIRQVRRQARAHPQQFARVRLDDDGVPRWLKAPLNFGKCFVRQVRPDGSLANTCAEHQEDVAAVSRKSRRVIVVCGGLAVIGVFLARKGDGKLVYAAGVASTNCLWEELFSWL